MRDRRQRRRSRNLECAARRRLARRLKTGTDEARAVVRLLAALGVCVSGRRGAERSERSEDGTPAARDPSEARGTPSGAPIQPQRLPPTTSCAPTPLLRTSPSPSRTARTTTTPTSSPRSSSPLMILNMLEGKCLPVYGEGKNVRNWLYVGGRGPRLGWAIMTRAGETYNV